MSSFDFGSGFCYCLNGDGIKDNGLRGFGLLSHVEPTFLGAGTGELQLSQGVENGIGNFKGTCRTILLPEQAQGRVDSIGEHQVGEGFGKRGLLLLLELAKLFLDSSGFYVEGREVS